jgi:hypothetical protein
MEEKDFSKLTDEELLVEKKKLKKAKIWHAIYIGFFAGVFIYGMVSWILAQEKNWGFFIPMAIPLFFIYGLVKDSKKNRNLERVLRERRLN